MNDFPTPEDEQFIKAAFAISGGREKSARHDPAGMANPYPETLPGGYRFGFDEVLPGEIIRQQIGILTEAEFARGLEVTVATLGTWRAKGIGPYFVKAGKTVYYTMSDIGLWLSGLGVRPGPGEPEPQLPVGELA